MSKTDRLSFIANVAGRVNRVLSRLAAAHMSPHQARRVLRRTCPKLHLNRA
jgi:hypothetical protein